MFRATRESRSVRHGRTSFHVLGEGIFTDSPVTAEGPAQPLRPSAFAALHDFRFSRLGPRAEPDQLLDRATRADLAKAMTELGPQPEATNPRVPAGFTYLGQFVDHDLTMDASARQLETETTVEELRQGRSPALDLDSLYGFGPGPQHSGSRLVYEDDQIRLRTGTTQGVPDPDDDVVRLPLSGFDLPRAGVGELISQRRRTVVPDERDDENLAVAQIHCAFIRFHNRVVADLVGQGVSGTVLFETARETVVKHYQWMLRQDFLPRIVDPGIVEEVFSKGRQFFEPSPGEQDDPTMPIEFSIGAYRLGHSMVRPAYNWNRKFDAGSGKLELLFRFTGKSGTLSPPEDPDDPDNLDDPEKGTFEHLPTNWIADFRRLFDFREVGRDDLGVTQEQFNLAQRIDTHVVNPLAKLPLGAFEGRGLPKPDDIELNLAFRNLTRANMLSLATGQQMAELLGVKPLLASDFDNRDGARLSDGLKRELVDNCPLWFYVLREAEVNGGGRLTGVGGRIVAEVFHRAMEGSRHSIVRDRFWHPSLSPVPERREESLFHMTDLLLYAFEGRADLLNPLGP